MAKEFNYKDDFEMLLFRHDYLKKVETYDPAWIEQYDKIIKITGSKMYRKYNKHMDMVGLDYDDAVSLCQLFTIYYMSLYSINKSEETLKTFEGKYFNYHGKMPTLSDQKNANRNQLINFIRQRFQYVNTLCIRKSRNIACGSDIKQAFAKTKDSVNACNDEILSDHKKYHWRKVTHKELKEAREADSSFLMDKDGFPIIEIERTCQPLDKDDFRTLMSNSRGSFNNSPEETMEFREEDAELKAHKEKFTRMNYKERRRILNRFIAENKGNKTMAKEMKSAKELLKELKLTETAKDVKSVV